MDRQLALLRGINLGGRTVVPMALLRELAAELGLRDISTYIASGNLLFRSAALRVELEAMLEEAVERRFGYKTDVMVRNAAEWAELAAGNPFPEESLATPNFVMLIIGKQPPSEEGLAALRARASANEKVAGVGDAVWIYYGDGAGRSKLGTAPARGVWTSRNWRTVVKLRELLQA